jgi:hypothetical protein
VFCSLFVDPKTSPPNQTPISTRTTFGGSSPGTSRITTRAAATSRWIGTPPSDERLNHEDRGEWFPNLESVGSTTDIAGSRSQARPPPGHEQGDHALSRHWNRCRWSRHHPVGGHLLGHRKGISGWASVELWVKSGANGIFGMDTWQMKMSGKEVNKEARRNSWSRRALIWSG